MVSPIDLHKFLFPVRHRHYRDPSSACITTNTEIIYTRVQRLECIYGMGF